MLTRVVSFFAAVHTLLSATRETCNTHLTRTLFALLTNVVSFCRIVTAALLVFVALLPRVVTSLLVLLPRAVTNCDDARRTSHVVLERPRSATQETDRRERRVRVKRGRRKDRGWGRGREGEGEGEAPYTLHVVIVASSVHGAAIAHGNVTCPMKRSPRNGSHCGHRARVRCVVKWRC